MKNFLVKATVAKEQLDIEPPVVEVEPEEIAPPAKVDDFVETPPPLPKYFSMDVVLDNVRHARELNKYVEEVASHLMNIPGAETRIHVAINISVPDGIPQDKREIITANCLALNIGEEHFHFEP